MRTYVPAASLPLGVLDPAADAAGRNGRWFNAGLAETMALVAYINQGNAATVALTLQQAQDSAGTGAKALAVNVPIYASADISAVGGDLVTRQTDGVAFTTDAGVKPKIVIFAIPDNALDVANGFKYLRIVTGASNAANITSAEVLPQNPHYQGVPAPISYFA
jgi:hypothetical protein